MNNLVDAAAKNPAMAAKIAGAVGPHVVSEYTRDLKNIENRSMPVQLHASFTDITPLLCRFGRRGQLIKSRKSRLSMRR
jgi:hypothetical protein